MIWRLRAPRLRLRRGVGVGVGVGVWLAGTPGPIVATRPERMGAGVEMPSPSRMMMLGRRR
ncbi:MAG: hypothetical protein KC457_30605, partial [Myxococcales bacterium]|nr:hypothetical protein [Myxococcales bacterium]